MLGDVYAEGRQAEEPLQMGWRMRNSLSKMAADFTCFRHGESLKKTQGRVCSRFVGEARAVTTEVRH
jgi:hypothetical protein